MAKIELIDRLEPEASVGPAIPLSFERMALCSIAVSLKRIADLLAEAHEERDVG